jgi:hypothetical protein
MSPLDPFEGGIGLFEGAGADAKAALSSVQKDVCAESPGTGAMFFWGRAMPKGATTVLAEAEAPERRRLSRQ